MISEIQRRQVERHCAATIRALSAQPLAQYRRQRLFLDGKGISLHAPHLKTDALNDSLKHNRGIADAIALRLFHCNFTLHKKFMPNAPVAYLVFDILEQLRCESLIQDTMPGASGNVIYAFNQWSQQCLSNRLIENEIGLLIYSITQIARSRLNNQVQDEAIEGLIESVRFRLAPVIGDDLTQLRKTRFDQRTFAAHAIRIAEAASEIAGSLCDEVADQHLSDLRNLNLLPPTNAQDNRYIESGFASSEKSGKNSEGSEYYQVYCRDYDRQINAQDMYRLEQRRSLRANLDQMIKAQVVSVPRLAQRLKKLFETEQRTGWQDGVEEGYIDGRRLGQIVSKPGYTRVFKQENQAPYCDAVVSFLIDNSGSMKQHRYEAVAILVDIYCRALELAGITTEILGFTTCGWAGGESIKEWRNDGSPENPGRLNDALHIVYKDANTSWRKSRYSISSLLNPMHFREGLDGEALTWASQRLLNRIESRKYLVMISDGAPTESATSHYNHEYYLENHFKEVAAHITRSGIIALGAIGIALDLEGVFSRAITLDLTGTLGNGTFKALELLFSNNRNIQ